MQFPTKVGVWQNAPLGYHDYMLEHVSLLVLVMALATGLAAAWVVSTRPHAGPQIFFRYFLSHILLFNLLVLSGLVLRYLQAQDEETLVQLFAQFLPVLLTLMTALKLGWLYAFTAANRSLIDGHIDTVTKKRLIRLNLIVLAGFIGLLLLAWWRSNEAIILIAMMILELIVLGGALAASLRLALRARTLPAGGRRQSLRVFGIFHLGLLALIVLVLTTGWIMPGPRGMYELAVNGSLLALFNLFPLVWIRKFNYLEQAPENGIFKTLGITARESEIAGLIQLGKTNQEIADQLFISVATVKDHNHNLFRKCGVRNRVELSRLLGDK